MRGVGFGFPSALIGYDEDERIGNGNFLRLYAPANTPNYEEVNLNIN